MPDHKAERHGYGRHQDELEGQVQLDAAQGPSDKDDDRRVKNVHGIGSARHGSSQSALSVEPITEPDQQRYDHPEAEELLPKRIGKRLPVQAAKERRQVPTQPAACDEQDRKRDDNEGQDDPSPDPTLPVG